jgi:lysophospholipase L1-like esterase
LKPSSIFLAGGITAALSCGGHGADPTPIPNGPSLICPAEIAATSHFGQPAPNVSFDIPVAKDGQPPVAVTCVPVSGSEFADGTTTVTCLATDSLSRQAACSFPVVVTPVPRLQKTKFLAFGDSFTEGKSTLRVSGPIFDAPGSYPRRLQAKLEARYTDQTITVIPDGWGGESAAEGNIRLREDLPFYNPEVLLLLEGANDLLRPNASTAAGLQRTIDDVIDALRNMIQQGKSRGCSVFVATLFPIDPKRGNGASGVQPLNDRIKTLAAIENVSLVDLHAVVPLSMLGSDGLHPKAETYDVIAETWFSAIVATLEVESSTQ